MQLRSARATGQRDTGQARCAVQSTSSSHGAAMVVDWDWDGGAGLSELALDANPDGGG